MGKFQEVFLLGYQLDDWKLDYPIKKSVKIHKIKAIRSEFTRTVISRNLPLYHEGATLPEADPKDVPTALMGVAKRFGAEPPKFAGGNFRRRKFRRFIGRFFRKMGLKAIEPDCDMSVETWLDKTHYPQWRKEQIRKAYDKRIRPDVMEQIIAGKFKQVVKSFIKNEKLEDQKPPRFINAREDFMKALFGPYFQEISDRVKKWPYFVKSIPDLNRPGAMKSTLYKEGATYAITDYTSFESQFIREAMEMIEFEFYKYMLSQLPEGKQIMKVISVVLGGSNRLIFGLFDIVLEATRMSGEMNTSLGNSFANLMLFLFAVYEKDPRAVAVGFVEGDDGIFRVEPPEAIPDEAHMTSLGFNLKIEITKSFETASFCGKIFDFKDEIIVTDPVKAILKFGWTGRYSIDSSSKYRVQLLRAKALSMLSLYNGCPLLSSFAARILELTNHVNISAKVKRNLTRDYYDGLRYGTILNADTAGKKYEVKEPPLNTRLLVEKLFGISISEQMIIEEKMASMQLGPVNVIPEHLIPFKWQEYYKTHAVPVNEQGYVSGCDDNQRVSNICRMAAGHPKLKRALRKWLKGTNHRQFGR